MYLIGNVENKDVIILDDIADTCNTIIEAAQILKKNGAKTITGAAVHAIFSNNAIENLTKSSINNLIFTNTISSLKDLSIHSSNLKFYQVDISKFLGECIRKLSQRC